MKASVHPTTLVAALVSLGAIPLLGIAYVLLVGFNTPLTIGYAWAATTLMSGVLSVRGTFLPPASRGTAIGVFVHSTLQAAAFLLMDPTPPDTLELLVGGAMSVAMLVFAYMVKQWADAGVRAAEIDKDVLETDGTDTY